MNVSVMDPRMKLSEIESDTKSTENAQESDINNSPVPTFSEVIQGPIITLSPRETLLVYLVRVNPIDNGENVIKAQGDPGLASVLQDPVPCPKEPKTGKDLIDRLSRKLSNLTAFNHITYLGSTSIERPKVQADILSCMSLFNREHRGSSDTAAGSGCGEGGGGGSSEPTSMHVSIFIPDSCESSVILYEQGSSNEIFRFKVNRIMFCARGEEDSPEKNCFAFTCSHGDNHETAIYRCHVFRCEQSNLIGTGDILLAFAKAFRKPNQIKIQLNSTNDCSTEVVDLPRQEGFVQTIGLSLEIKEEPTKGNFSVCPFDSNFFKFRENLDKRFNLTIQSLRETLNCDPDYAERSWCAQLDKDEFKGLVVERCFGIHITPGRDFNQNKLHLLDMISMCHSEENEYIYQISVLWDPKEYNMDEFIIRTSNKDVFMHFTLGLDLIFVGIQEPVRLLLDVQARLYPENERFWYINKRSLFEKYYLTIDKVATKMSPSKPQKYEYHLVQVESQSQLSRRLASKNRPSSLSSFSSWRQYSFATTPSFLLPIKIRKSVSTPEDNESDNDEPLLSGTGEVRRDCGFSELEAWAEILGEWRNNPEKRPKQILGMCKKGIPDALRGEVWQLLTNVHDDESSIATYQELISKESIYEATIQRDIHRTFPAHDYFKEAGSVGQDSLYRLSKAYAVYDQEIGYCQGLSFLAASLLLHMSEEKAFNVLLKIMYDYSLRNLFKQGFEELQLKFYQLDRLIEQNLPTLHSHFQCLGLEVHMFASQWFLTLFTAKFPLNIVFNILDIFLCLGTITIFHISLALLKMSEKELVALDFEDVLKFFRVNLPKKFRNEELSIRMIDIALDIKISPKRLKKYEKEYQEGKEREEHEQNPLEILKRENQRLVDANMRLERENDLLAHELVSSKVRLRNDLDATEDTAENLSIELEQSMKTLRDVEEENKRLIQETQQIKEMCRREVQRYDMENKENETIICDYKQICQDLSQKLEETESIHKSFLNSTKVNNSSCHSCEELTKLLNHTLSDKVGPKEIEGYPAVNGYDGSGSASDSDDTRKDNPPKL